MMTKLAFSYSWPWWIMTGFGLLSAGCSDSPDGKARLDDTPLGCASQPRLYRLTSADPSLHVANQLDLDGDGLPDDNLGRAHDTITSIDPSFAVAARFATRLASDVPWLIGIDQCGDEARVTIEQGMQLGAGDAGLFMPTVLPRAVGTLHDRLLTARDGTARIPLVALGDARDAATTPGWTDADGLVIRATLDDSNATDTLRGVFAAAIETDTARTELAPPIAAFLTFQPTDDILRIGADADHDGLVTPRELASTTMFRALIDGDVTIRSPDGTPRTTRPTTSISLAFTAVRIR